MKLEMHKDESGDYTTLETSGFTRNESDHDEHKDTSTMVVEG